MEKEGEKMTRLTHDELLLFAAGRMAEWYKRHGVKEISNKQLWKDCLKFGRLFHVKPDQLLTLFIDTALTPSGTGWYDVVAD